MMAVYLEFLVTTTTCRFPPFGEDMRSGCQLSSGDTPCEPPRCPDQPERVRCQNGVIRSDLRGMCLLNLGRHPAASIHRQL